MRTAFASNKQKKLFVRQNERQAFFKGYWKNRYLFIMLLPAVIHVFIFNYIPMYGLTLAFKDNNSIYQKGILFADWIGFDNFFRLFSSGSDFWRILKNTIIISILKLIFSFPAAIVIALLLNELRSKVFKKTVQSIINMPYFLSWVLVAGIIIQMLSPNSGAVNKVIQHFGGEPINFMVDKYWFLFITVASDIWQGAGWGSIIYLAAISNISQEIYESAVLDGAGRLRCMFSVTLPSIADVIAILFVLASGNILNAGFDQIFNLYNAAVYDVADIIDTYVYRIGIGNSDYSFTTSVGMFKNLFGLGLILTTNRMARRFGHTGLW